MDFDDQLKRDFDTVADRVRDDLSRHLQAAAHELALAVERDRAASATEASRMAREAAEREADERLARDVVAAEARGRDVGRLDGYQAGTIEGLDKGRLEGRQA